ncbi:hypothetical protein MASR2M41_11320 [Flammeovirgaceae bacterium]
MDIQAEKLKLIEWLTNLNDTTVIDKIKAIKSRKDLDWWESLSEEQKQDIEAGISDLDSGRKSSFSQVIGRFK